MLEKNCVNSDDDKYSIFDYESAAVQFANMWTSAKGALCRYRNGMHRAVDNEMCIKILQLLSHAPSK